MAGAVKQLRGYYINENGNEDDGTGVSIYVGQKVALGNCGEISQPPTNAEGRTIATIAFTPKSHASKLIIKGSPIHIGEVENVSDDFRIAVYRVSDGALLGWNAGSYAYTNNNPNRGILAAYIVAESWGAHEDSMEIKISTSGGCSSAVFTYNNRKDSDELAPPLLVTVTEVANDDVSLPGVVLQVGSATADHDGASTVQDSHIALGACSGKFTSLPTEATGYVLMTFAFTPLSSTSKLLVEGPPITIGEIFNKANFFRIAAFHKGVSLLGWNGGTWSYQHSKHSGYNTGVLALRVWADSWGAGVEGQVEVIIYTDQESCSDSSNAYHINVRRRPQYPVPPLEFTVTEVENI